MADFSNHTDGELDAVMKDSPYVEAMPEKDRDDLQIEWCKRNRVKFEKPDGTVKYVPDNFPE